MRRSIQWLPLVAIAYGAILALWFAGGARLGRIGFYAIFACVVTISVQLVGLFLVFITLVVPALATWYSRRHRLLRGYAIGALGYAFGLLASLAFDLPSGPMIDMLVELGDLLSASALLGLGGK